MLKLKIFAPLLCEFSPHITCIRNLLVLSMQCHYKKSQQTSTFLSIIDCIKFKTPSLKIFGFFLVFGRKKMSTLNLRKLQRESFHDNFSKVYIQKTSTQTVLFFPTFLIPLFIYHVYTVNAEIFVEDLILSISWKEYIQYTMCIETKPRNFSPMKIKVSTVLHVLSIYNSLCTSM